MTRARTTPFRGSRSRHCIRFGSKNKRAETPKTCGLIGIPSTWAFIDTHTGPRGRLRPLSTRRFGQPRRLGSRRASSPSGARAGGLSVKSCARSPAPPLPLFCSLLAPFSSPLLWGMRSFCPRKGVCSRLFFRNRDST